MIRKWVIVSLGIMVLLFGVAITLVFPMLFLTQPETEPQSANPPNSSIKVEKPQEAIASKPLPPEQSKLPNQEAKVAIDRAVDEHFKRFQKNDVNGLVRDYALGSKLTVSGQSSVIGGVYSGIRNLTILYRFFEHVNISSLEIKDYELELANNTYSARMRLEIQAYGSTINYVGNMSLRADVSQTFTFEYNKWLIKQERIHFLVWKQDWYA